MAREARLEQDRQATQARLSIARELHDVLAHSLSMINVQSSVTLELLNDQPERAGPALAAIKDASRQAISDVHSLVTALRADSGQPTAPTPGIADLDGLIATARDGVDRDDGRAGLAATAADGDRRRRGPHRAGVADRLFMSPATARTHVSRILTKLGARDRTQLVVMAYESGLVRPGWRS